MAHSRAVRVSRPSQIRAQDVYVMAVKLLARHGAAARDVAAFSQAEHDIRGDAERQAAWRAVESTVADLLTMRLPATGITIH